MSSGRNTAGLTHHWLTPCARADAPHIARPRPRGTCTGPPCAASSRATYHLGHDPHLSPASTSDRLTQEEPEAQRFLKLVPRPQCGLCSSPRQEGSQQPQARGRLPPTWPWACQVSPTPLLSLCHCPQSPPRTERQHAGVSLVAPGPPLRAVERGALGPPCPGCWAEHLLSGSPSFLKLAWPSPGPRGSLPF